LVGNFYKLKKDLRVARKGITKLKFKMLTKLKCDANEKFYDNIANISEMWIHKDTGNVYKINKNKYVLDNPKKLFEFCKWCSLEWVIRNTDFTPLSNYERLNIFLFFQKERGF
jgi:hypothetical protein